MPWLAYSIADQEGYTSIASVIILVLLAALLVIEALSRFRRKKHNKGETISVLEKRVEDWAIIVGSFSIALLANVPGAPVWTWAVASPIFLLAGIKSLYDAPKELALVAF
jgi:predicted CDP-diglyceride synthetase/phosphatidate cytidylyltransferase